MGIRNHLAGGTTNEMRGCSRRSKIRSSLLRHFDLPFAWLIRHSRRTRAVVRENIAFSLAVKAVFVILTLAGYASLWAAIAPTQEPH